MNTKHILHLANDYSGSEVYKNLCKEIDNLGFRQTIYTPIRSKSQVGLNSFEFKCDQSKVYYSLILNRHIDRAVYPYKLFKLMKDVESKVDLNSIDIIHAHTWYSDGGVAYLLSKKYNIPFIVAVRSTDINIFHKYLLYLHPFSKSILRRSKKVVFINISYKRKLFTCVSIKKIIKNKTEVIPNGVDSFWLNNSSKLNNKKNTSNYFNLLYIGTFIPRKNLIKLQQAVINLNKKSKFRLVLDIVGGGGKDEPRVLRIAQRNPNIFTLHGKVVNKKQLLSIMKTCDAFVMPSVNETFGLVYVESLLQSLPLLYTKHEGIDGFYGSSIGEKVDKGSIKDIETKLLLLVQNLYKNKYSIPVDEIRENHDWSLIAKKYMHIYLQYIRINS